MSAEPGGTGRSSFADLLGRVAPEALPKPGPDAPHGTTIVTATFAGGVAY